MDSILDTRGVMHLLNIAIWYDGTFRPAKGHHGDCIWKFDGQFFIHYKYLGWK